MMTDVVRPLTRLLARELTDSQIDRVSGGNPEPDAPAELETFSYTYTSSGEKHISDVD